MHAWALAALVLNFFPGLSDRTVLEPSVTKTPAAVVKILSPQLPLEEPFDLEIFVQKTGSPERPSTRLQGQPVVSFTTSVTWSLSFLAPIAARPARSRGGLACQNSVAYLARPCCQSCPRTE